MAVRATARFEAYVRFVSVDPAKNRACCYSLTRQRGLGVAIPQSGLLQATEIIQIEDYPRALHSWSATTLQIMHILRPCYLQSPSPTPLAGMLREGRPRLLYSE